MASPSRVRARYEGGVFKPLSAVELPDRTEVELTVVDRGAFEAWWVSATCSERSNVSNPVGDADNSSSRLRSRFGGSSHLVVGAKRSLFGTRSRARSAHSVLISIPTTRRPFRKAATHVDPLPTDSALMRFNDGGSSRHSRRPKRRPARCPTLRGEQRES
jgi:AF2212-like